VASRDLTLDAAGRGARRAWRAARLAAGALLCLGAAAVQPAAPAERSALRLEALGGGVHVVRGGGANTCLLAARDGVLVVDSKREDVAPELIALIRRISDQPIRYLVNTSFHEDHVGGNAAVGRSAAIIGHANTRATMLARPAQILREYPARLEAAIRSADVAEEQRLRSRIAWARSATPATLAPPDLTLTSSVEAQGRPPWWLSRALQVHVGDETVHVWVTRAASDAASETLPTSPDWTVGGAHVAVYFERAGVACLGDLFFSGVIPFEFVRAQPLELAEIERLGGRGARAALFVPGHGAVGDAASLEAYERYLSDVRAAATSAKKAGLSLDEFLAQVDLPAYKSYEGYPQRFKEHCAWLYDHFSVR
jgi:glyoxylase-like metal-dependent hydrolase (beta-lactamase superfamily II)